MLDAIKCFARRIAMCDSLGIGIREDQNVEVPIPPSTTSDWPVT